MSWRRAASALALTSLLAACAGGGPPRGTGPTDRALSLDFATGHDAMSLHRYGQAADAYRSAYRRALADDDADAIGTAGTDLAIALGAADEPDAALGAAATTRADLGIRNAAAPPELALAQAAALLRQDRAAAAEATASDAADASDPAVAERAVFLRGLAASQVGDLAVLRQSVDRLVVTDPRKFPPILAPDRAELVARLALIRADPASALPAALDAIRLRRDMSDNRGMRRALALAGIAARRLGRPGQADALAIQARQSLDADRDAPTAGSHPSLD